MLRSGQPPSHLLSQEETLAAPGAAATDSGFGASGSSSLGFLVLGCHSGMSGHVTGHQLLRGGPSCLSGPAVRKGGLALCDPQTFWLRCVSNTHLED